MFSKLLGEVRVNNRMYYAYLEGRQYNYQSKVQTNVCHFYLSVNDEMENRKN